jgi:two-component system response regulator PrrA
MARRLSIYIQMETQQLGSRLLLVEDNLLAAEAVRLALMAHGFTVQVINVGRQAIGSLIQRPADVVVIDLTLPDVDGCALAQMIRKDWPNLPIILTSGYDQPVRLDSFLTNRQTAFIQKPYDIDSLISTIEAQMSGDA